MKFKVGDKVHFDSFSQKGVGTIVAVKDSRVLPYLVHSLDIKDGHNAQNDYVQDNLNNYWFQEYHLELVTDDYITTKDFIKEVEKLGYRLPTVSDDGGYIESSKNKLVGFISYKRDKTMQTYGLNDETLFELLVRYAKTPIEFREEKEYEFELPVKFQGKFTQEEIDVLKKDEIFNRLNIKEV